MENKAEIVTERSSFAIRSTVSYPDPSSTLNWFHSWPTIQLQCRIEMLQFSLVPRLNAPPSPMAWVQSYQVQKVLWFRCSVDPNYL